MKNFFIMFLFLFAFKASALEIHMELEELVRESEVIVIADLSEVKEWSTGEMDYGSGTLTLKKVIWGNYKPGDKLVLYWRNGSGVVCPRNEHHDTKGQNYIWMLSFNDEGKLITGTNQRVRKLEEETQIDSLLKRHPFFMKGMRGYYPAGSAIDITLKYRNAHTYDVKVPVIAFKNGKIIAHPLYSVNVANRLPESDIIITEDSILVPARSEYVVTLPVRQIVNIDKPGYYAIEIEAVMTMEQRREKALHMAEKYAQRGATEEQKQRAYERYLKDITYESVARQGFYYINYK